MIDIAVYLIVGLFILLVILQKRFPSILCPLCISISSTWILGLLLYVTQTRFIIDPLLLGILMGGSAVGFMYFLGSRLPDKYQVFKLPFLLSLLVLIYVLLEDFNFAVQRTVFVISLLWLLILIIFNIRNSPTFARVFKKLVECCKNW